MEYTEYTVTIASKTSPTGSRFQHKTAAKVGVTLLLPPHTSIFAASHPWRCCCSPPLAPFASAASTWHCCCHASAALASSSPRYRRPPRLALPRCYRLTTTSLLSPCVNLHTRCCLTCRRSPSLRRRHAAALRHRPRCCLLPPSSTSPPPLFVSLASSPAIDSPPHLTLLRMSLRARHALGAAVASLLSATTVRLTPPTRYIFAPSRTSPRNTPHAEHRAAPSTWHRLTW